jgi:glutamate formiminotransferase
VLAVNVNFQHDTGRVARELAAQVRDLRKEGDERFLGVRAMAMVLDSREMTQVSVNLTMPDRTPLDPIVDHLILEASRHGVTYAGSELVGAIRDRDVAGAQHLALRPAVVLGGFA